MVVDKSAKQVVSRSYSVHIACEVQVDVLHRNDLSVSAASRTALDTKNRAKRRLSQSENSFLAYLVHRLSQTNGNSGLALSCRSRVYSGNKNKLTVRIIFSFSIKRLRKLSLVVTIRLIVLL